MGSNRVRDNLPRVPTLSDPEMIHNELNTALMRMKTRKRTLNICEDVLTSSFSGDVVGECCHGHRPQVGASSRAECAAVFDYSGRETPWFYEVNLGDLFRYFARALVVGLLAGRFAPVGSSRRSRCKRGRRLRCRRRPRPRPRSCRERL